MRNHPEPATRKKTGTWATGSFALIFAIIAVAPLSSAKEHSLKPADPSASAATRRVLNYLVNLPSRKDKRVFSGQLVFYSGRSDFPDWWDDIRQQTGVEPGLMHADNRCAKVCTIDAITPDVLRVMIAHWNAGGLVMLSAHHSNPLTGGSPKDTNFSPDGFARLLTPGDPVNAAYLAELDVMAQQLQVLNAAGVVVLYRPLLEMNGDWYWWTKGSYAQYVALWRMEFDYLTRIKSLHNLLFVWAANGESGHYSEYYPGNAFVDVASLDYYAPLNGKPLPRIDGYEEITSRIARSKPFGISEYGPMDPDTGQFVPQDYDQLIAGIRRNMPKVVFWSSHWAIWSLGLANPPDGRHLNVRELLSDPWVINEGAVNFSTGAQDAPP